MEPVPNAIGFPDEHVIHLHGEPDIKRRVPDIVVHLSSNRERIGLLVAIFYEIQAAVFHRSEIECHIIVPEIFPPGLHFACELLHQLPSGVT